MVKNTLIKYLHYLLAYILLGCQDTDGIIDNGAAPFVWVQSSMSPGNDITVFQFKTGEGGFLYINGWTSDNKSVFARFDGTQWSMLAQMDEKVIGDFAVYDDSVYYSTSLAVKKCRGTFVDVFLNTPTHCGVEVYGNRLFIAGMHLPYDGEEYSILSFNASKNTTPILQGVSNSRMKVANDKLFIASAVGFPLIVYNGSFVQESTYRKDFLNIDNQESIYSHENGEPNEVVINRFNKAGTQKIGNTIATNTLVTRLEFFENSIIVSGHDPGDNTSNSFILGEDNRWKPIDTGFVIYDLTNYETRILAGSDGKIMELIPK